MPAWAIGLLVFYMGFAFGVLAVSLMRAARK